MGKPPGMVEDYKSPNIDHDQDMAEHGAGKRSTKSVYIVVIVLLIALFLLVGIGLHIPAGESP